MRFLQRVKFNLKTVFLCGISGVSLLVVALFLGFIIFPKVVNDQLLETKILREDTEQWAIFKKIPFAFTFNVYLFTVENPEEILKGAKPVVKEKGPYVYKLYKWKEDIIWNYTTDEISYYEYEKYVFDQEASGSLTEHDKVTLLNLPYLVSTLKPV